ncbi:MAG TPA: ABC transporter ATP-binding protein [Leucothrix mucor]|nr:ABC transporter ATP-binding protein [Leucothrix mucor]
MNPILKVQNVSIAYGKNVVVEDISLQLEKGEIGCFLGPSGCGKTTLLRAIAGFEPVKQGEISLNDTIVSQHNLSLAPEKRNIGMVFQDFALFPHLTIADNIAFGMRHLKRAEQQARIQQLLEMVSLETYGSRYPHELSGGQQQRIALIRALAPKPNLLLLDEPFSSMDVELREELATEVRDIIKQENITAILVTHDQNEAFLVSDSIGVMKQGQLRQWADGYEIYHQPADAFVADFIGQGVFFDGEVLNNEEIKTDLSTVKGKVPAGCVADCKVRVFIRPDDIIIDDKASLKATVVEREFRGANYMYILKLNNGSELLALKHSHHQYNIGDEVGISLDIEHVVVFPKNNKHLE